MYLSVRSLASTPSTKTKQNRTKTKMKASKKEMIHNILSGKCKFKQCNTTTHPFTWPKSTTLKTGENAGEQPQVWWRTPVIPGLEAEAPGLHREFKDSLNYLRRPCLTTKAKQNKMKRMQNNRNAHSWTCKMAQSL